MRLIDADALKEALATGSGAEALGHSTLRFLRVGDIITAQPTIDPASLRTKGEWITASFWKRRKGHRVQLVFKKCSLCNIRVKARWKNNFCPNCGADMRGSP